MKSTTIPPCPFCGKEIDINDPDTLYPNGFAWEYDEELECRTYHETRHLRQSNIDQWCYGLHCECGAEMHGDTREQVIESWSARK